MLGWNVNGKNWDKLTTKHIREMTKSEAIQWLKFNDPNGIYTDAECEADNYDPLTQKEAQDLLIEVRFER